VSSRWLDGGRQKKPCSPALPVPLDRNHRPTSLPASPAPDPLFEVEHLGLRAEPEAQEELRREQSDVMAQAAQSTFTKSPCPRSSIRAAYKGSIRAPRSWYVPGKRKGRSSSMVTVVRFEAEGTDGVARSSPQPLRPHSSGNPALRSPAK
jgi:hypothetical protein